MISKIKFIVAASIFFLPSHGLAFLPSEVLVIANSLVPESVEIAHYYMEKRGIPKNNLLKIKVTKKEGCSRTEYDEEIAKPVRKKLFRNKNIKVLVTVYGVPLGVGSPRLTSEEKYELSKYRYNKKKIKADLKELSDDESKSNDHLKNELSVIDKQIRALKKSNYSAAVDSELSLVKKADYDLEFWLPNPFFVGNQEKEMDISRDEVLFVSRLDGPTVTLVKRIIDDSLFAEKMGLSGKAYFDAKRPRSTKNQLGGTAFYDQSLHLAAERVRERNVLPVVVDEKGKLFQAGDAPDAALYCGWYSFRNYIDAFDWVPGAIGYHIASVECASLRSQKARYWCRSMLEDGVAAVIGPVDEPYVQAFPVPEIFFYYLTDGYYNLVEAYFLSLPYLSWRMVLVGDPLYRPFAKSPNR